MDISKLKLVIKNNDKSPIILESVSAKGFKNATIIPANINSGDLGIVVGDNGLEYPVWLQEIKEKSKVIGCNILIIDGIDTISKEEQEKFICILKYYGVNGYKFPKGTRILLTIKKGNLDKISREILSLTINYK